MKFFFFAICALVPGSLAHAEQNTIHVVPPLDFSQFPSDQKVTPPIDFNKLPKDQKIVPPINFKKLPKGQKIVPPLDLGHLPKSIPVIPPLDLASFRCPSVREDEKGGYEADSLLESVTPAERAQIRAKCRKLHGKQETSCIVSGVMKVLVENGTCSAE